jgi:hypothetical protein
MNVIVLGFFLALLLFAVFVVYPTIKDYQDCDCGCLLTTTTVCVDVCDYTCLKNKTNNKYYR